MATLRNDQPTFAIQPTAPDACIPGRFAGKVILVTGAAGGIGKATAVRAAREEAMVALTDINRPLLEQTVSEIVGEGHRAIGIVADVRSTEDCERMIRETVAAFGRLDGAVNNAGIMDATDPTVPLDCERDRNLLPTSVADATDDYWQTVIDTNLTGVFKSLRSEVRQFLSQGEGGAIVNVGSITALTGMPGTPAYSASKHGVTGITRSVALDYAAQGIRCNSVNMAQTHTPMFERALQFVRWARENGFGNNNMTKYKTESVLQVNDPGHRGATPEEQAAIILWLLSPDASNMTGACVSTDGGWTSF
jgi:NAD(P)-dependent dehydrogenase (short-subunit alcohol dehydrogenase family)